MKLTPAKLIDYQSPTVSIETAKTSHENSVLPVFLLFAATILVAATLYGIHQNNRITATIKGLKEDVATLSTLSNFSKTEKDV
jgi:hypothetical protein